MHENAQREGRREEPESSKGATDFGIFVKISENMNFGENSNLSRISVISWILVRRYDSMNYSRWPQVENAPGQQLAAQL